MRKSMISLALAFILLLSACAGALAGPVGMPNPFEEATDEQATALLEEPPYELNYLPDGYVLTGRLIPTKDAIDSGKLPPLVQTVYDDATRQDGETHRIFFVQKHATPELVTDMQKGTPLQLLGTTGYVEDLTGARTLRFVIGPWLLELTMADELPDEELEWVANSLLDTGDEPLGYVLPDYEALREMLDPIAFEDAETLMDLTLYRLDPVPVGYTEKGMYTPKQAEVDLGTLPQGLYIEYAPATGEGASIWVRQEACLALPPDLEEREEMPFPQGTGYIVPVDGGMMASALLDTVLVTVSVADPLMNQETFEAIVNALAGGEVVGG